MDIKLILMSMSFIPAVEFDPGTWLVLALGPPGNNKPFGEQWRTHLLTCRIRGFDSVAIGQINYFLTNKDNNFQLFVQVPNTGETKINQKTNHFQFGLSKPVI
jgi:hypothetical protein